MECMLKAVITAAICECSTNAAPGSTERLFFLLNNIRQRKFTHRTYSARAGTFELLVLIICKEEEQPFHSHLKDFSCITKIQKTLRWTCFIKSHPKTNSLSETIGLTERLVVPRISVHTNQQDLTVLFNLSLPLISGG